MSFSPFIIHSYRKFIALIFTCLVALTVTACGGGGSSNSPSVQSDNEVVDDQPNDDNLGPTPDAEVNQGLSATALKTYPVTSSAQCPAGGIEVATGIDENQNGELDEEEIDSRQQLCHSDSDQMFASVTPLTSDSSCVHGGNKLTIGVDLDENGELSGTEITQSLLFCHQPVVSNLAVTLSAYSDEPEGDNCPYGGTKHSIGIDLNANWVLDDDEIATSNYTCEENSPIYQSNYYAPNCPSDDSCENTYFVQNLVAGSSEIITISNFYDDNRGEITWSLGDDTPDWFSLDLVEHVDYYYQDRRDFSLTFDNSHIPPEAAGESFNVEILVEDGAGSVTIKRELVVHKPIAISVDTSSITLAEAGNSKIAFDFVTVTFDEPLPYAIHPNSYYYFDDFIKITLNGDGYYSSYNNKFSIEWLNDHFYEGQTEATLMLSVSDNALPEDSTSYNIEIDFETWSTREDGTYFLPASFEVVVDDDGDKTIAASVTYEANEVTEGNDPQLPTVVPFTIGFSPAIPEESSVTLRIEHEDGQPVSSDICIQDNSYQCRSTDYITLYEGMAEYSGTLEIAGDQDKELDESFFLSLSSGSQISLEMSTNVVTILDDDNSPYLEFSSASMDIPAEKGSIQLPIQLSAKTTDQVSFYIDTGANDTAIEGTDYDFAVSQPITIEPGRSNINIPLIIYGTEFEQAELKASFSLRPVSGAQTDEAKNKLDLYLDKITPLSKNAGDYKLTYTPSTYSGNLYTSAFRMDESGSVYKIGYISNGALTGQTSLGSSDMFVAKFELDGALLWAKQFGTVDHDSPSRIDFSPQSGEVAICDDENLYKLSSQGTLSSVVLSNQGCSYYDYSVKLDSSGNVYLLNNSTTDIDADGTTSNIYVAKYNSDLTLEWELDDFSELEADHSHKYLRDADLVLASDGTPFLRANSSEAELFGKARLSSSTYDEDYLVFALNPEDGAISSYYRFGSDGDNDDYRIAFSSYGNGKVVANYLVGAGESVNSTVLADNQLVRVVMSNDGTLSYDLEAYADLSANSYLPRIYETDESTYFSFGGSNVLSMLDADLNEVIQRTYESYSNNVEVDQAPVRSSDGGFYLVDSGQGIRKMTPRLSIRR